MATLDPLFITVQEVKQLTPTSPNLTLNQNMEATLHSSQRAWFRAIIGECLYDDLVARKIANTLTAADTALIERAKPMMAYYALSQYLPYLNYQIRETGVVGLQGANYERTDNGFKAIQSTVMSTAETEKQNFLNWLCENGQSYPLWMNTPWWYTMYEEGRLRYVHRDPTERYGGFGISSVGNDGRAARS